MAAVFALVLAGRVLQSSGEGRPPREREKYRSGSSHGGLWEEKGRGLGENPDASSMGPFSV